MISLFITSLEMLVNDNKYVDIKDYDVEEIPNFLTDEECEKIIELSNNKLFPSKIYSNDKDLYSVNSRQSEQCWLRDDIPIIKNISDRVRHYTKTYNTVLERLKKMPTVDTKNINGPLQ
jgi:hypothetical protein